MVPRQFLRQLVDALDRIRSYEEYRPLVTIENDLSRQLSSQTLTEVEEDYVTF